MIFLLKFILLLAVSTGLLLLATRMIRVVYSPGGILTTALIIALTLLIPYAGWLIAAFLLIRLSGKFSDAELWPDAFLLFVLVIPLAWLLRFFLF